MGTLANKIKQKSDKKLQKLKLQKPKMKS